jgi:hypothetical protein
MPKLPKIQKIPLKKVYDDQKMEKFTFAYNKASKLFPTCNFSFEGAKYGFPDADPYSETSS